MKKIQCQIFKNLNYKTKQLKNNLITQIISYLITMHIDISIDPYEYIMEELKSTTYSLNNTKIWHKNWLKRFQIWIISQKFDGTFFHIWKHRLTSWFHTEKIWSIVKGIEVKPIPQTIAQIGARSHALLVTRIGVVSNWKNNDTMSLTLINNSIDNSTISHIQLCPTSHDAWNELIKLFESQDVVTKMNFKNKLHTLKMKTWWTTYMCFVLSSNNYLQFVLYY
jgi:hypothetical protein